MTTYYLFAFINKVHSIVAKNSRIDSCEASQGEISFGNNAKPPPIVRHPQFTPILLHPSYVHYE